MSKILKLNSYSQYDELYEEDYMVYEIEYDDTHKEYVSRDIFRNLKALEIIEKCINSNGIYRNMVKDRFECGWIDKEEYDLLKEVLL